MAWQWLRRLFGGRLVVSVPRAREQFARQRGDLERRFLEAAAASGKPRGLLWKSLQWEPEVVFAREQATGRLAALVGVTVAFEAVPGGDMEGLPAVGNLRQASAAFFYHNGAWHTTGRALFNLTPDEAIDRLRQYERLA